MSAKLLVVDDDVSLCETLQCMFTKEGFQVDVAHNGILGLQKAYALKPDVIILDVMMPDMDGWQTCCRLREMSDVPIIMLTALDTGENVVQGLDLGADDYVAKPVSYEVLAARVRALLRRGPDSSLNGGDKREPILVYDNLVIDFAKREVTVDGQRVTLSPTEYRLLSVLSRYQGRVLPHEFLLTEIWGPDFVGEIDYLRLYVSYLRRKVEKDPSKPSLIHNEWGVGYRFG
jgi:two-component system KDP operon response regulator KdpE